MITYEYDVYGALNRLEEAMNGAGKTAKYQYNGLGHRVGKLEGTLPADQTGKLDPQSRIDREIGNLTQIHYTIDLTREYHNLLEKTEGEKRQTYFWDGNVASYEENGRQRYYLQDELGSPIRIEDETGAVRESYGYGAFGEDLYGNQREMQPFGYTGYQRDNIAGTYYAQAREYMTEDGRFVGRDLIGGFVEYPETLNQYSYCWNNSLQYVDRDGKFPTIIAGAIIGGVTSFASSIINQVVLDKKINWKEAAVSAIGGAIKGGIAGSGIGVIGGVIATGVTGAATNVATQVYAQDTSLNEINWGSAALDGVIDAATYGYGRYKLKGKGSTVQEQLKKTNDDVHKARLHLAGYGKKRMKGKSYQRAFRKVKNLKKLQDQLAEKWLKDKGVESVKEIEGNFAVLPHLLVFGRF